jgi:tryptophanyl-tRNA synthetase
MKSQGKLVAVSGMRPTGKLHLGHLSVLENWTRLQDEYECSYFIADWHALTTTFDSTENIRSNTRELALDWLSVGLDPEKCVLFRQSDVKQHAEMHMLLSMMTPVSWLERVPTYKSQIQQFGDAGKDISMYGFLGYPVLMTSDVVLYNATYVPVGEDQVPHLELSREIVRRFNNMYNTDVLVEPYPLLAKIKLLPGIDNRKMSKSYNNDIAISAQPEEVKDKVKQMITDPARIKKTDLGHPDICTVFTYHGFYNEQETDTICAACKKGEIGCGECKNRLTEKMNTCLAPILARRAEFEKDKNLVADILEAGACKAREKAEETMQAVREAIKL